MSINHLNFKFLNRFKPSKIAKIYSVTGKIEMFGEQRRDEKFGEQRSDEMFGEQRSADKFHQPQERLGIVWKRCLNNLKGKITLA